MLQTHVRVWQRRFLGRGVFLTLLTPAPNSTSVHLHHMFGQKRGGGHPEACRHGLKSNVGC